MIAVLAAVADRILRLVWRDPGRRAAPRRTGPAEFDRCGYTVPAWPGEFDPPAPMAADTERFAVLEWTPPPADPEPRNVPLRVCAQRVPFDGWVAELVFETLDGLTPGQWLGQAFEPVQRGVVYAIAAAEQWAAALP